MDTEKKYTEEEIKAIANEEIRKAGLKANKELNLDEMEKVSGGRTHEEIDQNCDILKGILAQYGPDVAVFTAQKMGLISGDGDHPGWNALDSKGADAIEVLRQHNHETLDKGSTWNISGL